MKFFIQLLLVSILQLLSTVWCILQFKLTKNICDYVIIIWHLSIAFNKIIPFQNKCLCVCNQCRCRSVPNTNLQMNWTTNCTQGNYSAFNNLYYCPPYINPYLNPFYPLPNISQPIKVHSCYPTTSGRRDVGAGIERSECPIVVVSDDENMSTRTRKPRTIFTAEQLLALENRFAVQTHLNYYDTMDLVKDLGLDARQVKIWFRNRRSKLRSSMKRNFSRGRNVNMTRIKGVVDVQNEATLDVEQSVLL